MMSRSKKAAAAAAILMVSSGVAIAACGGTEVLIVAALGTMSTSLVASVGAAGGSIVANDEMQTERIISAMKVMTKQTQTSGEQYVSAAIEAEKSMASVNKDLADKELMDKVLLDFSSQGYDPCGQSAATKQLAVAEQRTQSSIIQRVRTEIEAGGGRYANVSAALQARDKQHQNLFCTQDEVDAGMCSSVGKVPGGDSNAALIFATDTSADVVAAKNAVINNIIGLPDSPLSPSAAATPEGQSYMMEKKRKDSFLAFAAYSLKSIQTENEQYRKQMDDRIGQFFGTDRATAWAKDQAGQSARGVLVDLLKIQGLQLKVREQRIKQNLRTEANVAALLELERQQTYGTQAQAASNQVNGANAADKVK